jgi:hypothetical protein
LGRQSSGSAPELDDGRRALEIAVLNEPPDGTPCVGWVAVTAGAEAVVKLPRLLAGEDRLGETRRRHQLMSDRQFRQVSTVVIMLSSRLRVAWHASRDAVSHSLWAM